MRTTLYIISDIHLGGAAGPEGAPGFQMCPPRNQAALAGFVEALPGRKENEDVRLVIAGDLVDFLAEEGFKPFTLNEDEACAKFDRIVEGARAVFDALQAFVGRGGALAEIRDSSP